MMTKSSYKYFLANGECVEYSLSSDCSYISIIDDITRLFFNFKRPIPEIWLRPEIVSALNKEIASLRNFYALGYIAHPEGNQLLKLETPWGPVVIIARSDMEFPIFAGSEQELKDNSFNASMEEILQS